MKEEQDRFLRLCGHAPVRLTVEQTAWVLNCQCHDIPILVAARLLRPLGNPAPNATKYFSTAEVLEAARDRAWLARMTAAVSLYWQKRNGAKKSATLVEVPIPLAPTRRRIHLRDDASQAQFQLERCAEQPLASASRKPSSGP